jgi:UDP-glucose 4-epimerase
MKALVVGAGGFIGGAVSARLESEGHQVTRVVGSLSRAAGAPGTHVYSDGLYSRLALALQGVELVVYAAGRALPRQDTDVDETWRSDCTPFNQMLKVLAKNARPVTVLLMSSGGTVYGPSRTDSPLTETAETLPSSAYGLSRVFMEQSLRLHVGQSPIRPIIFRLSNVYGPGQRYDGGSAFILRTLMAAAGNGVLPLYGTGQQSKDFLYVEDLLSAVRRVTELPLDTHFGDPRFNICSSHSCSLLEVIQTVEHVTHRPVPLQRVENSRTDVQHVHLSAAKARELLGWQATHSLADGIAHFWNARFVPPRQEPVLGYSRPG